MFALFLALSVALTLLLWAELGCPRLGIAPLRRRSPSPTPEDVPAPQKPVITKDELPSPSEALRFAERQARRSTRLIEQPEPLTIEPAAPELRENPDEAMWKRLEAMLHAPEQCPRPAPAALAQQPASVHDADDDLPRIDDLAPGERLELELDGPAPRRESIRFEQVQGRRRTRVVIEDEAILILDNTDAASLTPDLFQFRAPRAV
ncbi:hypothetical protein LZA78_08790 [Sinirhodobacter sp. WL0062]|uniref:Uncharacterized protein n=1 Tax=Rhodobacter flavimaris TaxID=2907145 RepID=A0ABS8YV41_9RHOB|nr:hypothetical protein [Sinirhodobacter sp. WL0062]MCE5973573.1 hypothetical protein [Sinirhodobacter sp. WL0062]